MTLEDEWPDINRRLQVEPGDSDNAGLWVTQATLGNYDGDRIDIPKNGVTAVVGSNNCGKSTLLRQLFQALISNSTFVNEPVALVREIVVDAAGGPGDALAWFEKHTSHAGGTVTTPDTFSRPTVDPRDARELLQWWSSVTSQKSLRFDHNGAAYFVVKMSNVEGRQNEILPAQQRGDAHQKPQHPYHVFQDNRSYMDRLNELCKKILGIELTLDTSSATLTLRVGRVSFLAPRMDESQGEYRAALSLLPSIQSQGDGIKSLLGILIPLLVGSYPIVIIDEPEAFLHPPQARALGAELGNLSRSTGVQVILATHDRNLLVGLLSTSAPVSVVRLTRRQNETTAAQLKADDLSEIWTDPVLKYSNVLDGLFHQLVVVCEADQDCRFYAAALEVGADLPIPASDVLFVPSAGKAAIAKIVRALRAASVRVVCTPDLDIINDKTVLKKWLRTWEATGQHSQMTMRSLPNTSLDRTIRRLSVR